MKQETEKINEMFPVIDWLIDYYLMSIEQYFSNIQDENKFNDI
jgi:hypothetical protein